MKVKTICYIAYILFSNLLIADHIGEVDSLPNEWVNCQNMSVCVIDEKRLITLKSIKGRKIDEKHWLSKFKGIRGKYLILHNTKDHSAMYPIINGHIMYQIKHLDQIFFIKYNLEKVEKLLSKQNEKKEIGVEN